MNWFRSRDQRDILGGLLLIVVGLVYAAYGWWHYPLGTFAKMGAGMFPTVLGLLLAASGVLVLIPALFRKGGLPRFDGKPLIFVILGALAFALSLERLGIIVAIFLLVALCSRADSKLGVRAVLLLSTGLAVSVVLIFVYGLEIPIRVFPWSQR